MTAWNPSLRAPGASPVVRLAASFAVLGAVVLTLPWFVPVAPVRSLSYESGFSNAAFIAAVLLLLVLPAFMGARTGSLCASPEAGEAAAAVALQRWLHRRAKVLLVCSSALILLLCWHAAGYGEAEYFMLRSAMARAGQVPYRDFEFAYGPLLLYPPVLLQHAGLSAGAAQGILVIGETAIGYVALRALLSRVAGRAAGIMFATLLFATGPMPLLLGQNYTFFRFAAAAALASELLARMPAGRAELTALLTGPLFLVAWLVSPEVAIAIAISFGTVATLVARRKLLAMAAAALSTGIVVAAMPLVRLSYATLMQFASGGNNLPGYPSFFMLLFLFSIFLSAAFIGTRAPKDHPCEWLLFVYSLCLLPGALGRSDPLHIVFYGFGFIVLAGRFCAESMPRGSLSRYCLVCALGFLAGALALLSSRALPLAAVLVRTTVAMLSPDTIGPLAARLPAAFREAADRFREIDGGQARSLAKVRPGAVVIDPRSDIDLTLVRTPYFVTLSNATTPAAFARLASELRGKRVLVRDSVIQYTCTLQEPTPLFYVELLFPTGLFPRRHDVSEVKSDFCHALRTATVLSQGRDGRFTELLVKP